MSIFENNNVRKMLNDGIIITVNVEQEKCTIKSKIYQDREVENNKEGYYSRKGIKEGVMRLTKKKIKREHAINIDKLVLDTIIKYDKKYDTKFTNKFLMMSSKERRFAKESKKQYEKRCVENRNSILASNDMEIKYDISNIKNKNNLKKIKHALKFINQYTDIHSYFNININGEQNETEYSNDEVETINSLIKDINNDKLNTEKIEQKKIENKETVMQMLQEIKKEKQGEIISNELTKKEIQSNKELEENISKSMETMTNSKERKVKLETLNEEERQMLEDISKSMPIKENNLFSVIIEKITNIKYRISKSIEERKITKVLKKSKKHVNHNQKSENHTKKLGYVGQTGLLVGLGIFLGISNHHVPTSTFADKQIEESADKGKDKLKAAKQNNFKKNIQMENSVFYKEFQNGDKQWNDFTVNQSQNNEIESNTDKEDKKENDSKENIDKKDKDKNKKEKDNKEKNRKSNVITAKEILSTIEPGISLKELKKGTFYASSEGEGPTGTFEKHIKEDKIVEMIKVTFEDGTYKIKNVEDDTNLYKLKKKYPGAEFSCHIKDLGWVNARTVIDARMKELKKEKNRKMVNKGQVVESTNSER